LTAPVREPFRAFRIREADGRVGAGVERLGLRDLSRGEVVIEAHYSSVNYKDALAATGRASILRRFPLVGGIDVSGVVVHSEDARFRPGDPVLVTGCGLSETHDGGYAEYARVPAGWVVRLPSGLSLFDVMAIGTAGFSAALAVQRMEDNRQDPELGPVLVTGASGGVGSFAVDLLSAKGYPVAAMTGKEDAVPYLRELGASEVLLRRELEFGQQPLEQARWGGAVDTVGGELLAWLTRTVRSWGNIVSIGLAGGSELHTTVLPFILRGVSLLGITSANCPMPLRQRVWERLASDLKPRHLARIVSGTVALEELPGVFEQLLAGRLVGRKVVDLRRIRPSDPDH
jgi:acrylyl-CoA reductase (NADPH)